MSERRIGTIILIVALAFTYLSATPSVRAARTWVVDASGRGDYTSLQDGVSVALPGDIVMIRSGNYADAIVDKEISLKGSDRTSVKVQKLIVASDGVRISSLTAGAVILEQGGTKLSTTTETTGENTITTVFSILKDLAISDVEIGYLSGEPSHFSYGVNYVAGVRTLTMSLARIDSMNLPVCGGAVSVESSRIQDMRMFDITCSQKSEDSLVSGSTIGKLLLSGMSRLKLYNNTIDGLSIGQSDSVQILMNSFTRLSEYQGIICWSAKGLTITGNTIQGYQLGIEIRTEGVSDCSNSTVITRNTIRNNSVGIDLPEIRYSNILIHANNLLDNDQNAIDNGDGVTWFYEQRGNYWNNWISPDSNEDGIVDKPYAIPGSARSVDRYPLVHPVDIRVPMTGTTTNLESSSSKTASIMSSGALTTTTITYPIQPTQDLTPYMIIFAGIVIAGISIAIGISRRKKQTSIGAKLHR